jgi:hypothetical protein
LSSLVGSLWICLPPLLSLESLSANPKCVLWWPICLPPLPSLEILSANPKCVLWWPFSVCSLSSKQAAMLCYLRSFLVKLGTYLAAARRTLSSCTTVQALIPYDSWTVPQTSWTVHHRSSRISSDSSATFLLYFLPKVAQNFRHRRLTSAHFQTYKRFVGLG